MIDIERIKSIKGKLSGFVDHHDVAEPTVEEFMIIVDELIAIRELKGDQVPVAIDADIIRDANRYRFLRDEDAWGEDSDSWDVETRTGLISSENLMGGLSPDHFDAAVDARMAASDIPFLNPTTVPQKPIPDELREDILRCVDDSMHGCNSLSAPDYAVRVAGWLSAGGVVKNGDAE